MNSKMFVFTLSDNAERKVTSLLLKTAESTEICVNKKLSEK